MVGARDRSALLVVFIAAVAVAALGLWLWAGLPLGVPGEWVWRPNDVPVSLGPSALAGLALVVLGTALCRPGRWSAMAPAARGLSLAALVLVVFGLQCALLNAVGFPWVAPGAVIASPNATTYFGVSLDVDHVPSWLASYHEQLPYLPHHARTHPPGVVLFFLVVRRLTAGVAPRPFLAALARGYNDTFGLGLSPTDALAAMLSAPLIALSGALALVPLYLLARQLMSAEAALSATVLAAAMPGLLLLGASPDLTVLAMTAATLALGHAAWRRTSLPLAFAAGLALAGGLFFTFAFAAVGGWVALWLLLEIRRLRGRVGVRWGAVRCIAAGLGGLATCYWALRVATGYRPVLAAAAALGAHREVTVTETARTYWKWLIMNPVEVAVFLGLPLAVCAIWGSRWRKRDEADGALRAFLLGWLVLVGVLNLSGAVRGEVGRIWVFLAWPAALPAAARLAGHPLRAATVCAMILLMVCQALAMRAWLTIYSIL